MFFLFGSAFLGLFESFPCASDTHARWQDPSRRSTSGEGITFLIPSQVVCISVLPPFEVGLSGLGSPFGSRCRRQGQGEDQRPPGPRVLGRAVGSPSRARPELQHDSRGRNLPCQPLISVLGCCCLPGVHGEGQTHHRRPAEQPPRLHLDPSLPHKKSVEVTIGDKTFKAWPQGTPRAAVKHKNSSGLQAAPKLFSTGSCGFMASTKARAARAARAARERVWEGPAVAASLGVLQRRSPWRWAVSPLCCSTAGGFGRACGLRASPRKVAWGLG